MSTNEQIAQLRGPILRSVSRSFYLSIRLLPPKLRDPIALAYLLARATDTIADTSEIDGAVRMAELGRLAALIQGENLAETFPEFAAQQSNEAERTLINAVPRCLAWLRAISPRERGEITNVLARINEGQTLDVQRFGASTGVVALATAADLDRYTYLVAGCVGEFWTNVSFLHLPKFSTRPQDEMLRLGIEYGKGLQLINILRDLGGDIAAGRCYLPAEELHSFGVTPSDLPREGPRVQRVVDSWRRRAEQGMAAGVEYACAIKPWRVRLATALPALIGARTLALLREAGPEIFDMKIKVQRAEVRRILLTTVASLAAPSA
ncbi:MAG TPA: phytoene/squalene synthase family protein, partial [Chthoniobacterales bacterium]